MIRHGQYVHAKKDQDCVLTDLGKRQAHATGKRIASMISASGNFKVNISEFHVSDMTRAKETAVILKEYLPESVTINESDAVLNEGTPAYTIPGKRSPEKDLSVFRTHPRAEFAFRKYFHRSKMAKPEEEESHDQQKDDLAVENDLNPVSASSNHEFEIIVGHGNMIRYFVMRALQLPPEAWLRLSPFNCSITYLVIKPSGNVSLRSFADVGHLNAEEITFSMHEGYCW